MSFNVSRLRMFAGSLHAWIILPGLLSRVEGRSMHRQGIKVYRNYFNSESLIGKANHTGVVTELIIRARVLHLIL